MYVFGFEIMAINSLLSFRNMISTIIMISSSSNFNRIRVQEKEGEVPGGGTWGKPGPGGAYWRQSALTGQGFFAKMVRVMTMMTMMMTSYDDYDDHIYDVYGDDYDYDAYWRQSALTGQGFFAKMVRVMTMMTMMTMMTIMTIMENVVEL